MQPTTEVLALAHSRRLGTTEPDGRLATLSCGAAPDHARTALAAQGWHADVLRLPDPTDPSHLTLTRVTERIPVTAEAIRAVQTIEIRHTDRRPLSGIRIADDQLRAITAAVQREGAWLHALPRDLVIELGSAVSHAERTEAAEEAWRAELAYWPGGIRPAGAGVPDSAIPERPTQTTVPTRDFGHTGTLPVSAEHDVAATRAVLRRLLSGLGQPYLVLRLGLADPNHAGPPHPPRLPAEQTIERG